MRILTGNWDINGNCYYGEWSDFAASGGVDFSPEVLIGRIPVYGTGYSILDSIIKDHPVMKPRLAQLGGRVPFYP